VISDLTCIVTQRIARSGMGVNTSSTVCYVDFSLVFLMSGRHTGSQTWHSPTIGSEEKPERAGLGC
jgi:hypothetical protein